MKLSPEDLLSEERAVQDAAIRHLYRYCIPKLARLMMGYELKEIEPVDIFQDGMAMLYLNLKKGRFKGDSSIETYTLSICKNVWLNKLRTLKHQESKLDQIKQEQVLWLDDVNIDFVKLKAIVEQLGSDCQAILRLYYYEKRSMDEITAHFGLTNKQSAKNKKARCMQQLMKIVKSAHLRISDFFDPE